MSSSSSVSRATAPRNFRKKRLTKDGWAEQVADMVDRGAEATDAQAAAIVDYLTQTFGKESKINVNTAPFEELKSVLGLTGEESRRRSSLGAKRTGILNPGRTCRKCPEWIRKKIENEEGINRFLNTGGVRIRCFDRQPDRATGCRLLFARCSAAFAIADVPSPRS